jgi:hypothetical protein
MAIENIQSPMTKFGKPNACTMFLGGSHQALQKAFKNFIANEKTMYLREIKKGFQSPYIWQPKINFDHHSKQVDH